MVAHQAPLSLGFSRQDLLALKFIRWTKFFLCAGPLSVLFPCLEYVFPTVYSRNPIFLIRDDTSSFRHQHTWGPWELKSLFNPLILSPLRAFFTFHFYTCLIIFTNCIFCEGRDDLSHLLLLLRPPHTDKVLLGTWWKLKEKKVSAKYFVIGGLFSEKYNGPQKGKINHQIEIILFSQTAPK